MNPEQWAREYLYPELKRELAAAYADFLTERDEARAERDSLRAQLAQAREVPFQGSMAEKRITTLERERDSLCAQVKTLREALGAQLTNLDSATNVISAITSTFSGSKFLSAEQAEAKDWLVGVVASLREEVFVGRAAIASSGGTT